MSESDLQSAVIAALTAIGCRVHTNIVVRKGQRATGGGKGSPDLLVTIPNVFRDWPAYIWLELKVPKTGRVSKAQEEWHATGRQFGERSFVVRSVEQALAEVNAVRFGRAK